MAKVIARRWEADGRDALSPRKRLILSVLTCFVIGGLLEAIGPYVVGAYQFATPMTAVISALIWGVVVGPILHYLYKSALWIPMLLVGFVFFVLDLANHFLPMTWDVLADGSFVLQQDPQSYARPYWWTDGQFLGLTDPLGIAFVSGFCQSLFVPIVVLVQRLLTAGLDPPQPISPEKLEAAFGADVTNVEAFKPKRDAGFGILIGIATVYGGFFVYNVVGLLVDGKNLPMVDMFFVNPSATINSFTKLTLMMTLALVGAYNIQIRRVATLFLVLGHFVSVGSAGLFTFVPHHDLYSPRYLDLMLTIGADGIMILLMMVPLLKGADHTRPSTYSRYNDRALRSPASTLYRRTFLVLAVGYSVSVVGILGLRLFATSDALRAIFGGPDPLVGNSLTKYVTLAAICFVCWKRRSLRRFFAPLLIFVSVITLIGTVLFGLKGSADFIVRGSQHIRINWFIMAVLMLDMAALSLLVFARRTFYRVDYRVDAMSPGEAECVMAFHRAAREDTEMPQMAVREVLHRIDDHIVGIRSRKRGMLALPFWVFEYIFPLVARFRPPFSMLSRAEARWMLRRFILRPVWERKTSSWVVTANLAHQMGTVLHSLVTLAYYSSQRGHKDVNYVLPDARERLQGEVLKSQAPDAFDQLKPPASLRDVGYFSPKYGAEDPLASVSKGLSMLHTRSTVPSEVDYLVIGSGAGGAVAAFRLAEATHGANICIIERGGYHSPQADFSDDEMRMIRMLYTEGGLQTTRTFDMTVLQGQCVGGTTVINNAVCFRTPDAVLAEWQKLGLDVTQFDAEFKTLENELQIAEVNANTINMRVRDLFKDGVRGYNDTYAKNGAFGTLKEVKPVMANFHNCLGCGLCNIGCRRLRKLSMLQTFIPWAVSKGVTVLDRTSAVSIVDADGSGGSFRATEVVVRRSDGEFHTIKVRKGVIVAAGAIASSRLLMRSNIGGEGVGRGMSCNYAFGPLAEFDHAVNAFSGLQISLFAEAKDHEAMFETSYNPPGSHSLLYNRFFEKHDEVMRAYDKCANFAFLVGSDTVGEVSRKRDIMFGRALKWEASERDMRLIAKAMETVVQIAAEAGAKRIFLPTIPSVALDLRGDYQDRLQKIVALAPDSRFFNMASAHPQGGNKIAGREVADRVCDPDFRVRGTNNVYVADASLFATGVRVNPQLSVMAMASMAAKSCATNSR